LKKLGSLTAAFLLLFVFISTSFSQGLNENLSNGTFLKGLKSESPLDLRRGRVLPLVTVHLMGSYHVPLGDLRGKIPEYGDTTDPDKETLRMKAGIGFGADAHIALGTKRQFRVVLGAGYVMFGHSQDGYKFGSDTTTTRALDIHINAFTANLGAEWAFRPFETMNPFIGLDLTGHFYSGKTFFDPAPTDSGYQEATLKSASRFGVTLGAGVDFAFGRAVGVVVGVKYNMHNLIGKSADDTAAVYPEYGLVDKEYTDAAGVVHPSKNLSDIQFYGGVSFYFGQPPKKTAK
jgi:opacity protein-like surface antigen